MNKDTARIITTFKCSRNCSYCANKSHTKDAQRIHLDELEKLKEFKYICVTGGEPMEYVDNTIDFIKRLKKIKDFTIYLYTARYTPRIKEVIPLVDGIHYSLHEKTNWKDLRDFYSFQALIRKIRGKSFRLFIFPHHNSSLCFKQISSS